MTTVGAVAVPGTATEPEPSEDTLDRVTYRTICVAFPLLTGMIATGAFWANRTWGSYWSWDPKETWAAITWLVYAGYLHMRVTRGWRGRRARVPAAWRHGSGRSHPSARSQLGIRGGS